MDILNRCTLCLEFTFGDDELLENSAKEMLRFVISRKDTELTSGHKICKTCLELLHITYKFKTSCLGGKDDIARFIEQQADQNFNHSALSTSKNEEDLKEGQCKICHLKFEAIYELKERGLLWESLLERHFYDTNTTELPASCEKCLGKVLNFLNTCLNTVDWIKEHCGAENPSSQTQENTNDYISTQFPSAETKNRNVEDEAESVTTIQLDNTSDGTIYEPLINLRPIFETVMQSYQDVFIGTEGTDTKNEGNRRRKMDATTLYQCTYCSYETKCKRYFKIHSIKHMDPSQVPTYKCHLCSYEAKFKFYVTRHMLTHKDPSEIKMHKCDVCGFEAKLKGNLSKHMKTHQPVAKMNITQEFIKCVTCGFETKHKGGLQKHRRCERCDFETCDFTAYRAHVLKHEDPPVLLFSCSMCSYQGKSEALLKKHALIHKDPSQIKMYRCEQCYYETRHKHHIDSHTLIHKDPWEVKMYRCGVCSYETRHKRALNRHQQIHKKTVNSI